MYTVENDIRRSLTHRDEAVSLSFTSRCLASGSEHEKTAAPVADCRAPLPTGALTEVSRGQSASSCSH